MIPFKRREDSFLGIHFDFHALPGQKVPSVWHPEYYAEMLDAVRPDFVQCDTKGHAGLASYPTDAGTRAELVPGIDILKMMRAETAKRGIALYAHHSGLYDQAAGKEHPEWCAVFADGTTDHATMSVFGPYAEKRLLPQLRELAGVWHLDGAWIDGDCWMLAEDYSPWALDAYRRRTGKEAPHPGEKGFQEYREFCREGFHAYVENYVEIMHREFPGFQITSNWIWSSYMPESDAGSSVDFLSGDYSSVNSVCSARFHGRILEARNRPWDLMAWGHNAIPCSWTTRNRQTKEPSQYCQEAAMTISMGGAFECFNIHYGHGGAIQKWAIPAWKKMAEFCREREICFRSRIRPELGVLFPADRNADTVQRLYNDSPNVGNFISWIDLLQDCAYSTKALFLHQIEENDLSRFRVIVIPATDALTDRAAAALKRYAELGGTVLADGPAAKYFTGSAPAGKKLLFVDAGDSLAAGEADFFEITGGRAGGKIFDDNIFDADSRPAFFVSGTGKGKIAELVFSMSEFYRENRSEAIRKFMKNVLEKSLSYTPSIRVSGSSYAELAVAEKEGELLVNLVNMAGPHSVTGVRSFAEIPPLGPLTVTFEPELQLQSVRQIPEGNTLEIRENDDFSRSVTIPRLEIHTVLQVKLFQSTP